MGPHQGLIRPDMSVQVRPIAKLAPYINKIFASVFCAMYALCNGCSYLEGTNILLNEKLFI